WLFSGGARSAPDADGAAALALVCGCNPFGENALAQAIESARFTEKMSFVGADAVEHVHHFDGVSFDEAVVSRKRIEVERAQPLPQAADEHGPILCAKVNPGFIQDEFLEETELVFCELRDCRWELEYGRGCVFAERHYALGVTAVSWASSCVALASSLCRPETVSSSAALKTRSMFRMRTNYLTNLPIP